MHSLTLNPIPLYGAGRRRVGYGRRRHRGGDFLGIGNFFRNTIPRAATSVYNDVLKPAGNYIAKHPLSAIGTVGSFLPGPFGAVGKAVGVAGKLTGLGRRRRRRGGNMLGFRSGFLAPMPIASNMRGRGRRRRVVRRRRGRGPLLNLGLDLISKARKLARKAGYGRRRVVRRRRGRGPLLNLGRDLLAKARNLARKAGYGRRRVVRRRRGRGPLLNLGRDLLAKARNLARKAGYGRRRVIRRRRGGNLSSYLSKAKEGAKHIWSNRRYYSQLGLNKVVPTFLKTVAEGQLGLQPGDLSVPELWQNGLGRRRRRHVVRRRRGVGRRRRGVGRRRVYRRRRGGNLAHTQRVARNRANEDLFDGGPPAKLSTLQKIKNLFKPRHHFLVSRGLRAVGLKTAANFVHNHLGYGRRRRRVVRRRRRGGNLLTKAKIFIANHGRTIGKVHSFVRKHGLVSKGLKHLGFDKASSVASAIGYGRRRRRGGRRRVVRRRR